MHWPGPPSVLREEGRELWEARAVASEQQPSQAGGCWGAGAQISWLPGVPEHDPCCVGFLFTVFQTRVQNAGAGPLLAKIKSPQT